MTNLTGMVREHPIKSVLLASLSGAAFGFLGQPRNGRGPTAKSASRTILALILETVADRIKRA
jgi:hypothetical protein